MGEQLKTIKVTANDKLYDITFTVKDPLTRLPINLEDVDNIKFQVADMIENENILNAECSIILPTANGRCKYTVQEEDFTVENNYYGMLQITYESGKIISTKKFKLEVKPELG